MHPRARAASVLATVLLTSLSACSLAGGEDDDADRAGEGAAPRQVVLVTHESFHLPEELQQRFAEETGFELEIRASGDAGALTNKLVLSKDNPIGDAAFGVDNTFASRALDEGVFASYAPDLPAGAEAHELPGDDEDALTPVDTGNVCVNVDTTWFAERGIEPPATLDDLTEPAYENLFVVPGATTSSPGMAFLLATIAEYGDGWTDYWTELMANGAELTPGWSEAYQARFTQGGGDGDRPIVVSYDSSPAFTIAADGTSTTAALLDTCFRQVEYVGVLAGARNPEGAEALVDFLLTEEVQAALPEAMYVFPVSERVELPPEWAEHARQPESPYTVDPAEIAEQRDEWLREWSDLTSR